MHLVNDYANYLDISIIVLWPKLEITGVPFCSPCPLFIVVTASVVWLHKIDFWLMCISNSLM